MVNFLGMAFGSFEGGEPKVLESRIYVIEDLHEELNKEFRLLLFEIEVNDHRISDNAEVEAAKMF